MQCVVYEHIFPIGQLIYVIYYVLLISSSIYWYYGIYMPSSIIFVSGSLERFNVIEPSVQPVHNGWTIEPLN
jgi:hypothetical protein